VLLAAAASLAIIGVIALAAIADKNEPTAMISLADSDHPSNDKTKRDNGSGANSNMGKDTDGISESTLEGQDTAPVWHAAGATAPPAPPASALAIDYLAFFTSDMFAHMSDTCCKTIFFPPGHGERLPMELPLDGAYVLRIRNFIAGRNTFLFNGADAYSIAFINRYYGFHVKQIPVVSGFKRKTPRMVIGDPSTPSAVPEAFALERKIGATYYGGLPNKLAPTEDMVSVDTLSLPGASIIVYNNWPRVPTGTPAFIIRYCQIEDPYKEGGKPLKVEVIECPAAEARGYPCSCGFINFLGWNWQGSNANVWESSVVNGDDLALSFGLFDAKGTKHNKKAHPQQLAHEVIQEVNVHENCAGGNCHFV
jgi:hypothetical protein